MGVSARKVTVHLPEETLARAMEITGKGITATLVDGLRAIEKGERRSALRRLRGKVRFELDLERTRR